MNPIRIACISDTHGKHGQLIIPDDIDILLHAGDFTGSGQIWETKEFMHWFNKQEAPYKIFISGNHDFMDQDHPAMFKELLKEYPNITYLRDEGTTVEGIKIWGRPWTPEFYEWAFMADRGSSKMLSTIDVIPSDTDIILTHGPVYGILDKTKAGELVGCQDLKNFLEDGKCKPKALVVGHIHESAGYVRDEHDILHVNAAVLNERYINSNKPIVLEYYENGRIIVL